MFFDLIFSPITLPVNGIAWISEKILEQTGSHLNDREQLQKQLLALQLAFDLGEIDEAVFEAEEEELLLAIQAIEEQPNS
jgi:hypothetical protein